MTADQFTEPVSTILSGKSFVVSGVFMQISRDELKASIKQHGGKLISAISSNTDFLIAGDKMGPAKLAKAQKLGVEIISEEAYLNMIKTQ